MSDDIEIMLRLSAMAINAGIGWKLAPGQSNSSLGGEPWIATSEQLIKFAKLVAEDIAKRTDCRCAHDTQSEKDCKQSLGSRCFRNQAQDIRRYYGL